MWLDAMVLIMLHRQSHLVYSTIGIEHVAASAGSPMKPSTVKLCIVTGHEEAEVLQKAL